MTGAIQNKHILGDVARQSKSMHRLESRLFTFHASYLFDIQLNIHCTFILSFNAYQEHVRQDGQRMARVSIRRH
jgi:hypothetical protein